MSVMQDFLESSGMGSRYFWYGFFTTAAFFAAWSGLCILLFR